MVLLKNGKAAYSWASINYLNKVVNTRNLSEKEYGDFFYWGNYKTSNDSLFVTYIMPPSSMLDTNWSLYEIIFLVKNKRKLKMLHYKVLPGYVHDVSKFSDFNFYESEKLPNMNIPSRFKYLYECD